MNREDDVQFDAEGAGADGHAAGTHPDRQMAAGGRSAAQESSDRRGGTDHVPGEPGAWPARVHVSEADRSELLKRIVGG